MCKLPTIQAPRALRFDAESSTLTIRVKGKRTDYTLERIGSDWGDGFRLTKHVGHESDECDIYDIHLSDEGHTCECLGFLRHSHCKHIDALVRLRQNLEI